MLVPILSLVLSTISPLFSSARPMLENSIRGVVLKPKAGDSAVAQIDIIDNTTQLSSSTMPAVPLPTPQYPPSNLILPTPIMNSFLSETRPADLAGGLPTPITFAASFNIQTTTVTITHEELITVTISASPTTTTEIVTATPSIGLSKPSPLPVKDVSPAKQTWASPSQMTDLAAFKVTKFTGTRKNLQIVKGLPAKALAHLTSTESKSNAADDDPTSPAWDNSTSVLQLFFPQGSIDPARKPQGGAQFYASPINLSSATNVTLAYSVFFPKDFDWVQAGKLPGLYGGHTGCSGGNDALTCFSTRLMWRAGGAGELYLYAPKAKQTKALCSDPLSTCDAVYGFSVGRGSFEWAPGRWTKVTQTVVLNTPGMRDGSFSLEVNGKKVIDRNDIYYRGGGSPHSPKGGGKSTPTPTKGTPGKGDTITSSSQPKPTPSHGGGILGPILGGILGLPNDVVQNEDSESLQKVLRVRDTRAILDHSAGYIGSRTTFGDQDGDNGDGDRVGDDDDFVSIQSSSEEPIGFLGIFFSTFFGGHEDRYATPKDQYAWFKDFSLIHNA